MKGHSISFSPRKRRLKRVVFLKAHSLNKLVSQKEVNKENLASSGVLFFGIAFFVCLIKCAWVGAPSTIIHVDDPKVSVRRDPRWLIGFRLRMVPPLRRRPSIKKITSGNNIHIPKPWAHFRDASCVGVSTNWTNLGREDHGERSGMEVYSRCHGNRVLHALPRLLRHTKRATITRTSCPLRGRD